MQYPLGEYELGQMRVLLSQLDGLYPESVAARLRQLLTDAIQKGFVTQGEIHQILEMLPLVIPEPAEDDVPAILPDGMDDDWSAECQQARSARRRRASVQLQQRLSHLLFMQETSRQVTARKSLVNKIANNIL